jgi:hypothetical protein
MTAAKINQTKSRREHPPALLIYLRTQKALRVHPYSQKIAAQPLAKNKNWEALPDKKEERRWWSDMILRIAP